MSSPSGKVSPPPLKRPRLQPSLEKKCPSSINISAPTTQNRFKDGTLRVYSWNVNGISSLLPADTPTIASFFQSTPTIKSSAKPQKPRPPTSPLRDRLREWNWPDVVGFQEVKIASTDRKTQSSVRRAANPQPSTTNRLNDDNGDDGPQYDVHFCLPTDKHNATGFGGRVHGVCLLISQRLITTNTTKEKDYNVRTVPWDHEGRILILEFPFQRLAVFNIYALNGTSFPYRDSSNGKVIGTRHDRKRVFHALLADEIRGYEEGDRNGGGGWGVVLAGDMNISPSTIDSFPQLRMGEEHVRNRADFHKKFIVERGMVDSFRSKHGDGERKYTYRPRNKAWGEGGDRVDMILVSKALEGDLAEADILDTEVDRGPSDHVPLFVDLQTWKG